MENSETNALCISLLAASRPTSMTSSRMPRKSASALSASSMRTCDEHNGKAWSSQGIEKHHLPFLEYFLSPWYILTIPTVYVPLHLVLDGECLVVCFQVASLCISLAGSDRYCFLMWCHCSFWVSDVDSCSDEKVWTSHVPSSGIMGHAHHV